MEDAKRSVNENDGNVIAVFKVIFFLDFNKYDKYDCAIIYILTVSAFQLS